MSTEKTIEEIAIESARKLRSSICHNDDCDTIGEENLTRLFSGAITQATEKFQDENDGLNAGLDITHEYYAKLYDKWTTLNHQLSASRAVNTELNVELLAAREEIAGNEERRRLERESVKAVYETHEKQFEELNRQLKEVMSGGKNTLLKELAEVFDWKDKSYLHAVLHVKNAILNLRADLTTANEAKEKAEKANTEMRAALESGQEIIFEGNPHRALNVDLVNQALSTDAGKDYYVHKSELSTAKELLKKMRSDLKSALDDSAKYPQLKLHEKHRLTFRDMADKLSSYLKGEK